MSKCGKSKAIIKWNASKHCPVAVDEIFLAKIVFEPGVASIKGNKSSQHTHKINTCIYTFFINNLPFLATISRNVIY